MKILHVSDTHGQLPRLEGDFDLVVHSGDLMPNCRGTGEDNAQYQKQWIVNKVPEFKDWLQGRPMFFCPGNHDFFLEIERVLDGQDGMAVNNLYRQVHMFNDFAFTGLPHVPWFGGGWNFEQEPGMLEDRTNEAVALLREHESDKQVLVAHCPPYGLLDRVPRGEYIGNYALKKMIQDGSFSPRAILCGHCHESAGKMMYRDTYISNAACSQRLIEFNDV